MNLPKQGTNYILLLQFCILISLVTIERKNIILKPKFPSRKIHAVLRNVSLKEENKSDNDLNYWMDKTPTERLAALTFLVRQSIQKGQRMDKTRLVKRRLKP